MPTPAHVPQQPARPSPSTSSRAAGSGGARGSGSSGSSGGRLVWADVAKGISIIGVCFMHVVTGYPDGMSTGWGFASSLLDPLRMPLFFLISGLFSYRVLERTLGQLWRRRLWFLLVPYLVFTPFHAWQVMRGYGQEDIGAGEILKGVLLGDPGLWFLHALILYNLAAWALRRVPPPWAVAASVLPLVAAAATGAVLHPAVRQVVLYMPAFFVGLHARRWLRSLADHALDLRVAAVSLALFVGWEMVFRPVDLYFIADGYDAPRAAVGVVLNLVRTAAAVPLGIVIAAWLARVPGVSRGLAFVGRNTLPVYVSHLAALTMVRIDLLPRLVDSDPERWDFLLEPTPNMLLGLATCAAAGTLFYWLGKVPYLRWTLYPPPLPGGGGRRATG